MHALTLVTAPAAEPLTLVETKDHLRIDHATEDSRITAMILAARNWGEGFTRRAFITQTWDLFLDYFPPVIDVPRPPLQSVTSITYVDGDGNSQTLATSVYTVDADSERGRIYLAYDQSWPSLREIPKAVTVRFVAGYGATYASVPEDLRQALLMHVSRIYEMREPVVTGTIVNDTGADQALLRPYQIGGF